MNTYRVEVVPVNAKQAEVLFFKNDNMTHWELHTVTMAHRLAAEWPAGQLAADIAGW